MPNSKSDAFTVFSYVRISQSLFLIFLNSLTFTCFSQNQWTWMSGYLVSDAYDHLPHPVPSPTSVRGTPWVLGSNVKPSVREHSAGGIANNNEIYVYGGSSLEYSLSADFWVYDISQQKWAFISDMGGTVKRDSIGKESSIVNPGGRSRMASAVDNNGNVWFFGGLYNSKVTFQVSALSDLMKYNPKSKKWTYYGSDDGSENKPHGRYRARAWFDDNNNLWLYGGAIEPNPLSTETFSYNDLWMYNTTTNVWTFVSGNKNTYYCKNCPNGAYPATAGTGGTQYFPRARSDYGYWEDNLGNIWIYGGYVESHGLDDYGDLWKFNPTTSVWTLISGSDAFNLPKTATYPGSRNAPYCWVGTDNKLYMSGGSKQFLYFLRDTWRINPANGNWEVVKEDNLFNEVPISAGLQIENSTNTPGSSVNVLNHLTTGSHTYLFSGYGMGSNNLTGLTGAMWRYSLDGYDTNLLPIANSDTIAVAYRDSIYCNIKANDIPKAAFKNTTFDIDINLAGIQDTLSTAYGRFSIDTTGLVLFKPITDFQGTVYLNYTYQNTAKYVSNTAQLKLYIYKCATTTFNLTSPTNDINKGNYEYKSADVVNLSNKITPQNTDKILVEVNSGKHILLLPGLSIKPNSGSTFEAKIKSCN
jgi:hypothetical protein